MSTPTGENAFLDELEHNVRAELTLAESGQPEQEAGGVPIDEWLFDPTDAQRDVVELRSLLGAVDAMEVDSRPGDHPSPTEETGTTP